MLWPDQLQADRQPLWVSPAQIEAAGERVILKG